MTRPQWMPVALVLAVGIGTAEAIWAQDVPVLAQPGDQSLFGLTFAQVMMLVTNLGLGGIVFVVWFQGIKRQTSMEYLLDKYNETQQAHLAAFRDIVGNYQALAKDTKDTLLLAVQVQTRLVERLEHTQGGPRG